MVARSPCAFRLLVMGARCLKKILDRYWFNSIRNKLISSKSMECGTFRGKETSKMAKIMVHVRRLWHNRQVNSKMHFKVQFRTLAGSNSQRLLINESIPSQTCNLIFQIGTQNPNMTNKNMLLHFNNGMIQYLRKETKIYRNNRKTDTHLICLHLRQMNLKTQMKEISLKQISNPMLMRIILRFQTVNFPLSQIQMINRKRTH